MHSFIRVLTIFGFIFFLGVNAQARPGRNKAEKAAVNIQAEENLQTRVYQVADLVLPIPNFSLQDKPGKKPVETTEAKLIQLISSTVDSPSWKIAGGQGDMQYDPKEYSLTIQQTANNQDAISSVLASLRKLQDLSVVIETRVITLSEPAWEKLRELKKIGLVGESQRNDILEMIQSDKNTNVMLTPKITLFDGQSATIKTGFEAHFLTDWQLKEVDGQTVYQPVHEKVELGFQSAFKPVVSVDKKTVYLEIKIKHTNLVSENVPLVPLLLSIPKRDEDGKPVPDSKIEFKNALFAQQPQFNRLTAEQQWAIPNGKTMVSSLGTVDREVKTVSNFTSGIPYLSRMIRQNGVDRQTSRLVLMVTPRIISVEESEAVGSPFPDNSSLRVAAPRR